VRSRQPFIRNFEAGQYLDWFLVTAVTTVLLIRAYLELTGYPQIGGGTLHIAHMLWGGLGMLVAMIILLSFLGRGPQRLAAVVGGAGFGTFIDEVGKFVTKDNDYFFQPSVAIMYVVFILIYLAVRAIHREGIATSQEYLVNALQELGEAAIGDLDQRERDRALQYLGKCDPGQPLAPQLRQLLIQADLVPEPEQGWLKRLGNRITRAYQRISTSSGFARLLIFFFVIQLVLKLLYVGMLVFADPSAAKGPLGLTVIQVDLSQPVQYTFADKARLSTSLLAGVFVALGVFRIRRDRLRGLRMFQRSILVYIFLTQVFIFYQDEWAGLVGMGFNLLVLAALDYMLAQERRG